MRRLLVCIMMAFMGMILAASADSHAQSPPVRVLSSLGLKAVLESVQPDMERAVGRPLSIEFSSAASLKGRIEAGEPFDVAILTPALIDDLALQGKVTPKSRIDVARAGVGVGAREGGRRWDVSTREALRHTLLTAGSVALTVDGQSRAIAEKAFAHLRIAEAMESKTVLMPPGEAQLAVAEGRADLVLSLVSEILPIPGLELMGPLPAEVQGHVSFAAGRSAQARDAGIGDALLKYLEGRRFLDVLQAHGMESVVR